MPSATDTLLAKTDAELRFFADNPQFYQPELVQAARRELQRRGLPAATPAPAPAPTPYVPGRAPDYEQPTRPERPAWAQTGGVLAVVTAALVGGWLWWHSAHHQQAGSPDVAIVTRPEPTEAEKAAKLSPEALKLETVTTYAIPAFDVPKLVQEQLASVPASQKQNEQLLRQFRALSKRFWTAETQSEYLINAAYTQTAAPTFADQALLARQTWRPWNQAAVYTFKFGPVMNEQLEMMRQVASSQQHILERLPDLLPANAFLDDQELSHRQTDVQAWMASLRATSPVTGEKYKVPTLHYHE